MADSTGQGPVVRKGASALSTSTSTGDVSVTPYFPHGVAIVRSGSGEDPVSFGSSLLAGEAMVSGIRPGEAMVIGSPEAVDAQVAAMGGDRPGTVDISHSRSVFSVSGSQASKALEKVCSLDWSDSMMPNGACSSASVAKISCDVVRADDGEQPRYLVICGRSWGQYLHESLIDAAAEFV